MSLRYVQKTLIFVMILLGMTLILQFEEIWYLHVRFRNKFLEMYELNVEGKIKCTHGI